MNFRFSAGTDDTDYQASEAARGAEKLGHEMRFTITMMVLGMVALVAIPGVSGHPASTAGMTPEERLATMQADFGFAVDPYAAAEFTIHLPTGFTTLDAAING